MIFLYWLLVVSKVWFSSLCRLFSAVHKHACRSTQNAKRIKRFLRLHIVIKPLIKNRRNKFFITFKRNSLIISWNIWLLSKVRAGWPYRWFFWTVSLIKSPRVLRWSWILNECNLSWKIVKYCILYEVCMIKTAPHSTLSPQMWGIKKK